MYHSAPSGYSGKLNSDWILKQYTCIGGNPSKIVMGIPFYGRFWFETVPGDDPINYPLFRKAKNNRNQNSYGGSLSYWQLIHELKINNNNDYQLNFDERSKTPWAINESMVITYDNEKSIKMKIEYAMKNNLGGVMIWSVDQDDEEYSLLQTVNTQSCQVLTGNHVTYKCNPLGTEKR